MRLFSIFQIFTAFLNFTGVNALKNCLYTKSKFMPSTASNPINNNLIAFYKNKDKYNREEIDKKVEGLFRLTRPKNIAPTIFLSFSGGWIMEPSAHLFTSVPFIISVIDAVIIMSISMIINDIYDIEVDKINSPERPLASGAIKVNEAIFFSLFLLGTCEYLTLHFMLDNLQLIIQLIIVKIIIYTPILKKMLIVKNVSCATLVAFSLFFSGLATSKTIMSGNENFGLLTIAMSLIFFGSLTNEILLDIRDTEGDKYNNITTVSTTFGKEASLKASTEILNYGIITNTFVMAYLYDNLQMSLIIPLIFSPLIINLQKIKKIIFLISLL